ncbi:hypothetical protein [Halobiforma nitratireducens]|nr:hypothetical protein [Halobiforma nitratireducens]
MALSQSTVESAVEDYREHEPFFPVEQEQIETLPAAFRRGEFGWRDAAWVVRWYYRRSIGGVPNAERRRREAAFERNDYRAVRDAIVGAAGALESVSDGGDAESDAAERDALERLTVLEGVDVPVASAFLFFCDPDRRLVVGEREWEALGEYGPSENLGAYPDPPSIDAYGMYLDHARALADGLELECELAFEYDMWTLYRALWRRSPERE